LDGRGERVAVVASTSWSHSFLTHRLQCCAFDAEFDRRNLERLRRGRGSELITLTPGEIYLSGDHEFLNWIIVLGIIGDKPEKIVDVLDTQSQITFKVFAIWE
jgi:catalytic LigB subunit of aromatic ring-opening dioxygenase